MTMASSMDDQLKGTADLVEVRLSMGDDPTVPREVDHSARFRRRRQADAAAAELSGLGYGATVERDRLRLVLEVTHVTTVDLETAQRFTVEVVSVVERHGGTYDGWGAMIEERHP